MSRRCAVVVMILLAAAVPARGAEAEDARLVLAREAPANTPEAGSLTIELDAEAYGHLWRAGRGTVTDFPLPGGARVDLDLRPFRVLAPGAVVVNVDSRGEHRGGRPDIRFLRGEVKGEPGSLVVLGLFQNRISGFVRTLHGEFGVGPVDFSLSGARAFELRVWSRDLEETEWSCGVTDEVPAIRAAPPVALSPELAPANHLGGAQLRIDLAVDSTTEWCAHFGDDPVAAQNYLLSTVAQISAIYDSELLLLVEVPFLRTFCGAPDPYTNGLTSLSNRSQLLSELTAEWSANQGAVQRTVTHLYTWSSSSSAGGLANTVTCSPTCQSVLCNPSAGYGVNLLPATGGAPAAFEVRVAAHELGHNHSSPHTNCLRNGQGAWLSTCAVETCGLNPWCQAAGCFPGPVNTNMTGTIMSTGCNARTATFEDSIEESILRGAAESASCVEAAGLPGESLGLRVARAATCPSATLRNDDNSIDSGLGGPVTWVKRFTPACFPFRIDRVDVIIPDFGALVGRPIRILIYADLTGSGDPANASLVYVQDTTVQTVSFSAFNMYTLAQPVTVTSGDVYLGFFDPVGDGEFLIAQDSSAQGNSYYGFSTSPTGFTLDPTFSYMIRGSGGPVPAESLVLTWDPPCNDATTPGQDFAVYRGQIGVPGVYTDLTCTTNDTRQWLAEAPANGSFFLVVPQTSPSEGSYGRTSGGLERPPAFVACKPQNMASCP